MNFEGALETPDSLQRICNVIEKNAYLEELIISKNALGVTGAKALSNFLINNINLKHFIIDDAGLGKKGGIVILESILNSKRKKSFLETISIKENVLGKGCSKLLSMVLQNHQNTLTKVVLSRNNFYNSDICHLMKSLNLCNKLQIVNIEDNFFTTNTSRMLSKSLINWPDLKQLIINDCLIDKKGIIYILEALSKGNNPGIEYLGLQYCNIYEEGFFLLASIIKSKLIALNKLKVHGNHQVAKNCILKLKLACERNETSIDGLDELIDEEEVDYNNNEVKNDHDDGKGKGKGKDYDKKKGKGGNEKIEEEEGNVGEEGIERKEGKEGKVIFSDKKSLGKRKGSDMSDIAKKKK